VLALYKFVRLIKQTTEVTYKPTLEMGIILLSSRGISRVIWCFFENQWLGFVVFSFGGGGVYKFTGKEGEGQLGLWSQIYEKE
jgi:hypothetical protein